MKSTITYILLFSFFVFYSCEYDATDMDYNLGTTFISDAAHVYAIDTVKVKTYTITQDSFKTSGSQRLLTGSFTNEYQIETYCESYFRFEPTEVPDFHESAIFDSICMIIHLDGYHFGDSTQIGKFEVYRLLDSIIVDDDTDAIYNTTKFRVEDSPLGQFSIDLEDEGNLDSVVISLSYDLGKSIFDSIDNEAEIIENYNDVFQKDFFRGIMIKPLDNTSAFVVGINAIPSSEDSPRLRFYYHDKTIYDEKSFDFALENTADINYKAFCFIENRYENSLLNGSEIFGDEGDEKKESSKTTNGVTFIQTGLLDTRIEIPTIDEFHYLIGTGAIMKSELYIEPIETTFEAENQLPSILTMDLVDKKNRFYDWLNNIETTEIEYGYLYYNKQFRSESFYLYDITFFAQTEYADISEPNYTLRLKLPNTDDYLNVDQLIIGDSDFEDNELKLKFYITGYDEDLLIED